MKKEKRLGSGEGKKRLRSGLGKKVRKWRGEKGWEVEKEKRLGS